MNLNKYINWNELFLACCKEADSADDIPGYFNSYDDAMKMKSNMEEPEFSVEEGELSANGELIWFEFHYMNAKKITLKYSNHYSSFVGKFEEDI